MIRINYRLQHATQYSELNGNFMLCINNLLPYNLMDAISMWTGMIICYIYGCIGPTVIELMYLSYLLYNLKKIQLKELNNKI